MNRGQKKLTNNKISREFAARLNQLEPGQTVRAIIFLKSKEGDKPFTGRRQSPLQRKAAVDKTIQSTKVALKDIDTILKGIGGRRLEKHPGALGSILVETTPTGINELASSKLVKTILEDQPISSII